MAILQEKGIFNGGDLSLSAPSLLENYIFISPYLLNLTNGSVTGSGGIAGVAKKIKVVFSTSLTPGPSLPDRTATKAPTYQVTVGNPSGVIWIFWNEATQDIEMSVSAPINKVVFGKVSWPTLSGKTMDDLVIDLADRTEACVAAVESPQNPSHFYLDGQKWISGNINKPFANLSILQDVLIGESLVSLGGEFFLTFLEPAQIYTEDQKVIVRPCTHVARSNTSQYKSFSSKINEWLVLDGTQSTTTKATRILDGVVDVSTITSNVLGAGTSFLSDFIEGDSIKILSTGETLTIATIVDDTHLTLTSNPTISSIGSSIEGRANAALVYEFSVPSLYQNHTLYFLINKTSGVAKLDVAEAPSTHYTVARTSSSVGPSATDLSAVTWEILNDLSGIDQIRDNLSAIIKTQTATGFLTKPNIDAGGSPNTISFKTNLLHAKGLGLQLNDQEIDLGAPPSTGSRLDFVWLEYYFTASPYLKIEGSFRKAAISSSFIDQPFSSGAVLSGASVPASFSTQEDSSEYSSTDSLNTVDGKRYAVPVAIVGRFNTAAYSQINTYNLNGGVGRPDGKTALQINKDEILNLMPFVGNKRDDKAALGSAIRLLLSDTLANSLNQASYTSGGSTGTWSRFPLQIDYLGSYSSGNDIGPIDNMRVCWSRAYDEVLDFGFKFISNVALTGHPIASFNTVGDTLTIHEAGGSPFDIKLDPVTGDPLVTLTWVSDGTAVDHSAWNVDPLTGIIDTVINVGLHAHGEIAVMVKASYEEGKGFTKTPISLLSALRNGASGFSNYYGIASTENTTASLTRILSRSVSGVFDRLLIDRVGVASKFYAHTIEYHVASNGGNFYSIPIDQEEDFTGLGVWRVENASGVEIKITDITHGPTDIDITLNGPPPAGNVMKFFVGCGGNQLDYDKGSLAINNLSESALHNLGTSNVAIGDFYYTGTGDIFYGGMKGLYINNVWVPIKIIGYGTNLLKITTQKTLAEYNNLTTAQKALYTSSGSIRYVNTGYNMIGAFLSRKREDQSIVMTYNYSASPWRAYTEDLSNLPLILDRGFLLLSTDGPYNIGSPSAKYSPFSERFPIVQGIEEIGLGVEPSPVGINDIISYHHEGELAIEGNHIVLDGSYLFNTFVQANTGLAVWLSLVKIKHRVLLFCYEVREGVMALNSESQAFITELEYNRREHLIGGV